MNWITFVKEIETDLKDVGYIFPVQLTGLDEMKQALGINELPEELETLLKQTNGIQLTMNGTVYDTLIWPVERIIADNLHFRNEPEFKDLYMSFDQLLFFADAGNGDQFAYVMLQGRAHGEIFKWDHEDDSRTIEAYSLEKFLVNQLTNQ